MLIITDPHGCFLTFQKLYNDLKLKFPNEGFCVAGDLIDRGPRSYQLVQFIIDNNIHCVRGNHEQMVINKDWVLWKMNGGIETENSYPNKEEFQKHCKWFEQLPYFLEYKDIKNDRGQYLLVTHAAATEIKLEGIIATEEILWNRSLPKKDKYRYNVFGHTPVKEPIITKYYANIDTGCAYKNPNGNLTALRFPQMEIFKQENID